MKIAIHQNKKVFNHSTSWDNEWIKYCKETGLEYCVIDAFRTDLINYLKDNKIDVLLWHYSHYSYKEMLFARNILSAVSKIGLQVFPNAESGWHFDDKVAQSYLLDSIGAPIPKYWVFYEKSNALEFLREVNYPLVLKLKGGSGSSNVKLINNYKVGKKWVEQLHGSGVNSSPNLVFKAKSNVSSTKNMKTFISRIKRIPDFIESLTSANDFPKEKGYIYFQEFIENENYDLKVVVVNNKLSFLNRPTRKNDFRASGGGSIEYNMDLITEEIRQICFDVCEELNFSCMGFDFVIDKYTKKPYIVEISYGFSHQAQIDFGGYWRKNGEFVKEPLNAPAEVLKFSIKARN